MTTEVNDTIVAVASGPGPGGVAVIRLSGDHSFRVLRTVFRQKSNSFVPRKLTYGAVVDAAGEEIDRCLAVTMPGPASFTGENVAEIHCHGGPAIISDTIRACCDAGARPAEPGEFSRRAFLNGKIDLVQAEALCALITAESDAARKIALRELNGGLSTKIRELFDSVVETTALIEAHLDFPDEEIPDQTVDSIIMRIEQSISIIDALLDGFERNRRAGGQARVVFAGQPNAGKSSLFNALVGRERAIVSPHPGTTRDSIEATIEIKGFAITLVDTAGLRETIDEVERIGIERTESEMKDADLIVHLLPPDGALDRNLPKDVPLLTVRSKSDIMAAPVHGVIAVSAHSGNGIQELENAILESLNLNSGDAHGSVSRIRHATALETALRHLYSARQAQFMNVSGDLIVIDLRDALSEIGQILGVRLDEQILDRVFSTFCIGK